MSKKLGKVRIKNGPLAGMVFTPTQILPGRKHQITVRYAAPSNGPCALVTHTVNGKKDLCEDARAEDVRLAFSHLLPGNIVWDSKSGYSDRTNGVKLQWDSQLMRFTVKPKK